MDVEARVHRMISNRNKKYKSNPVPLPKTKGKMPKKPAKIDDMIAKLLEQGPGDNVEEFKKLVAALKYFRI